MAGEDEVKVQTAEEKAEEAAAEAKAKAEAEAKAKADAEKAAASKKNANVAAIDATKKLWQGKFKLKFKEGINFTYAGLYFETKTGQVMSVNDTLLGILLTRGCVDLVP